MTLRSVLLDDTWTPRVRNIINNDIDVESITYYFSDTSSNVLGFEQFVQAIRKKNVQSTYELTGNTNY